MGQIQDALDRLHWEHTVIEINRGFEKAKELLKKEEARRLAEEGRRQKRLEMIFAMDMTKQAYLLDKELPRDLNLLMELVRDEKLPVERRAKILEVIILRGASNEFSYAKMGSDVVIAMGLAGSPGQVLERRQYQAAAFHAVLNADDQGKLFGQLSRSRDQLPDGPSGRYPATEWMNTMLRQGGLAGEHKERQEFEKWLLELDPEPRGQAMFHMRDAMQSREMGDVTKLSGFEVSGGPVGFGLSWVNAKDTHWDKVGSDMLKPVSDDLAAKPEENKAFYDGYRLADRNLPDPKE